MGKRILVPIDGSPQSASTLAFVVDEWPDAEVVLLHVIDPRESGSSRMVTPSGSEEWYQNAQAHAEEAFDDARDRFDRDFDAVTQVGSPAKTIVSVASEGEYDHVVVGSHGRTGVSRIILGSVAETVVRRSPVPVTVVR